MFLITYLLFSIFIWKINGDCIYKCRQKASAPVCASNRVAYASRCVVDCLELKVAHWHHCKKCNFPCPAVSEPVCGSDKKIYLNQCFLLLSSCSSSGKIKQTSMINCCKSTSCKLDDNCVQICSDLKNFQTCASKCAKHEQHQICGSDGQIYPNLCVLECRNLNENPFSHCDICDRNCHFNYNPVCGSNGKLYPNSCSLDVASCILGETIDPVPDTECSKTITW